MSLSLLILMLLAGIQPLVAQTSLRQRRSWARGGISRQGDLLEIVCKKGGKVPPGEGR